MANSPHTPSHLPDILNRLPKRLVLPRNELFKNYRQLLRNQEAMKERLDNLAARVRRLEGSPDSEPANSPPDNSPPDSP